MWNNWPSLFSPPAFGFTNEQHELRGKKFFCVISESLSVFFFFCRVNPNLKDLKPTFALKTESLCIFWMKKGEKKIKSHRGISFLSVQESSPSVWRDHFVSNFSHLATRRQVSWGKAPDPRRQSGGGGNSNPLRAGRALPPEQFVNCSERGRLGSRAKRPPRPLLEAL